MTLEEMMAPKNLSYYQDMTRSMENKEFTVKLNMDQIAVVLKAYDHGTNCLQPHEMDLLNQVIGKLKDEIWP